MATYVIENVPGTDGYRIMSDHNQVGGWYGSLYTAMIRILERDENAEIINGTDDWSNEDFQDMLKNAY